MRKRLMSMLLSLMLILNSICIGNSMYVEASEDVVITATASDSTTTRVELNEENFPDNKFREYLSWQFDGDGDGYINPDLVEQINVEEMQIYSLKGIELFKNLEYLNCYRNRLTSLDVSKNTKLDCLICSSNKLTSLNVGDNPSLLTLYCVKNQLTELDVSGCPGLKHFSCDNNQLTELDVRNNTKLIELRLGGNSISELVVSANTALEELQCSSNKLTELE